MNTEKIIKKEVEIIKKIGIKSIEEWLFLQGVINLVNKYGLDQTEKIIKEAGYSKRFVNKQMKRITELHQAYQ